MKLLDKIAKSYNIKSGEKWVGSDENYYKIVDGKLLCCCSDGAYREVPRYVYFGFISGILIPVR